MTRISLTIAIVSTAVTLAATNVALADCESDLLQLEQAYKTANLAAPAKAALDESKPLAVAALKKDDDATCHSAILGGMTKAGIAMK